MILDFAIVVFRSQTLHKLNLKYKFQVLLPLLSLKDIYQSAVNLLFFRVLHQLLECRDFFKCELLILNVVELVFFGRSVTFRSELGVQLCRGLRCHKRYKSTEIFFLMIQLLLLHLFFMNVSLLMKRFVVVFLSISSH